MPATAPNAATHLTWTRPDGTTKTGGKDAIMRAFYEAGYAGTIAPAPAVPAPVPAVAVAAPVVSAGFHDLVVDEEKGAKIEAAAAKVRAAGFALPDPWFAPGTRLMQVGVDKYRTTYGKWADRPLAGQSMESVAQRIREERRTDFVVRLGDLRMDASGGLGRKGSASSPIESTAWPRIYGMLRDGGVLRDGGKLLMDLEPATRAMVVNERLAACDPDKEVKIGLRRNASTGGWAVFRAVSTRYPTDGQADAVLASMAKGIKDLGWRGSVVYDTGTTRVSWDACHMADPVSLDPAVGDVFRAGVKGGTHDAGGGRFWLVAFAGRIVCINCTIMDAYAPGIEQVHRGSMAAVLAGIPRVVSKAVSIIPTFATDWRKLRNTPVKGFAWDGVVSPSQAREIEDVPTALRALSAAGKLDHGTARDALVQHMLNAHKAEPGTGSLADVLNAATRAAHEGLVDAIQRDVLERQAGALVPVLARAARKAG